MPNDNELDNLLVRQKDCILARVNDRLYNDAMVMLTVVTPLWLACNYDYKRREILSRIVQELLDNPAQ